LQIKGVRAAGGELMTGNYMAIDPGTVEKKIEGISTKEPAFGLPALWIPEKDRENAQMAGYTVVDLSTVVATHISEVLKGHVHLLVGRQEVQKLLDNLSENYPKVVEELIPTHLSLGEVVKVLQNLLKEGISIRDLVTILETLADNAPVSKNPILLTEHVRQALARTITKKLVGEDRKLSVITLDQRIEDLISQSVRHTEQDSYLSIEPEAAQKILMTLNEKLEGFTEPNLQPVVLCSPVVRPYFKQLTERFVSNLIVLSHNEISSDILIESIGVIGINP
jgi:flagellar biosynthesis protein FlhA